MVSVVDNCGRAHEPWPADDGSHYGTEPHIEYDDEPRERPFMGALLALIAPAVARAIVRWEASVEQD